MAYQKQTWENLPSTNTPITASRLNHIEDGIEDVETGLTPVTSYTETNDKSYACSYINNKMYGLGTYSITDEVTTGKYWIDGKPIYRKTYALTNITPSNEYSFGSQISNLDLITSMSGVGKSSNNMFPIPRSHRSDFAYQIGLYYRGNNTSYTTDDMKIEFGTAYTTSVDVYVILEYTKTTNTI